MEKTAIQYIAKQSALQQKILKKIRRLIKNLAPEAHEALSSVVPAFKLGDENLLMYAAFKNHIGIYPDPATIKFFKKELKDYEVSKGAIRLPLDQVMPHALLERIIKYKYNNLLNKNKKWRKK